MRYCTKCGNPLPGMARFCTGCGAPVRAATDPLPPADQPPPPEDSTQVLPSPAAGLEVVPGFWPGEPPTAEPPRVEPWFPPAAPSAPREGRVSSPAKPLLIVLAVVVLAAGGAVAAWRFLLHHPARPAAAAGALSHHRKRQVPHRSAPAGTTSPAPSPSQPSPANPHAVTIAPAVGQEPAAAGVATFVQRYFTAINSGNYGLYISLLEPSLRPTVGQFDSGYRGTRDTNATLTALSPTTRGVAARVRFTSHQPAGNSPTHTGCTDWTITLYLRPRGSGYRIMSPPPGYHARYAPC